MRRPDRGPTPVAKTPVDQNTDVDILLRRIGRDEKSAVVIDDLEAAGLVTRTSEGTLAATKTVIDGPQNLYNFLKRYR